MINKEEIQDFHAIELINSQELEKVDNLVNMEIIVICKTLGVDESEIPVDEEGYITSNTLKAFAIAKYCEVLFSSFWGGAVGNNDIYFEKSKYYSQKASEFLNRLTKDNILNTNIDQSDFVRYVPIY